LSHTLGELGATYAWTTSYSLAIIEHFSLALAVQPL